MLARLPRPYAVLVTLLLLAALGWCLAAPRQEIAKAPPGHYTDMRLYRDIVQRMDRGESYYAAATAQQRAQDYPTKPFVTVRLPPSIGWPARSAGRGWAGSRLLC